MQVMSINPSCLLKRETPSGIAVRPNNDQSPSLGVTGLGPRRTLASNFWYNWELAASRFRLSPSSDVQRLSDQ